MIAAPTAQAATLNLSYDGGIKFTFDGNQFNSLPNLDADYLAKIIAGTTSENDNLQITNATQAAYIADLINVDEVSSNQLVEILGVAHNLPINILLAEAKPDMAALRELQANGTDLSTIIDLNDLFKPKLV